MIYFNKNLIITTEEDPSGCDPVTIAAKLFMEIVSSRVITGNELTFPVPEAEGEEGVGKKRKAGAEEEGDRYTHWRIMYHRFLHPDTEEGKGDGIFVKKTVMKGNVFFVTLDIKLALAEYTNNLIVVEESNGLTYKQLKDQQLTYMFKYIFDAVLDFLNLEEIEFFTNLP